MYGEPTIGPEIDITLGGEDIEGNVVEGYGILDSIAKFLEEQFEDLCLEPSGVPGSAAHANGYPFSGQGLSPKQPTGQRGAHADRKTSSKALTNGANRCRIFD